jgi:acyl carrier protein
MSNLIKYKKAFAESLSLKDSLINDKLEYESVPEWDSIGHMSLMSSLEQTFKISISTDDVVEFSSFKKGKTILKKYKVKV